MKLVTVVELPTFIHAANRCLDDDDRDALIFDVACDPEAGDLIQGTGGVRKLR